MRPVDAGLDFLEREPVLDWRGACVACMERGWPEQSRGGGNAERPTHHLPAAVTPQNDVADGVARIWAAWGVVMGLASRAPVAEGVSFGHMPCQRAWWLGSKTRAPP